MNITDFNDLTLAEHTGGLSPLCADCKGGTEIHTNLRGIPCASLEFEKTLQVEQLGHLFDVFIV